MPHFDVFNGDADGLCALHQLRLVHPCEATLITGVKRDIALLARVPATKGDSVTVLDVSLNVNRTALIGLLEQGVSVQYFDHHESGAIPLHPALNACIDHAPDVCTGTLVDRWLGGPHRRWAVVAAFGDNLAQTAHRIARECGLHTAQIHRLQALGECLNYNAYGDSEADLIIPPAELYRRLHPYADPFSFIDAEPIVQLLQAARRQDLDRAQKVQPYASFARGTIMLLPDAPWSRRVCGPFANILAERQTQQAHAVVVPDTRDGYTVSVRAPLGDMQGADRVCRAFPDGGGRPAAAGINHLSRDSLAAFIRAFEQGFAAR